MWILVAQYSSDKTSDTLFCFFLIFCSWVLTQRQQFQGRTLLHDRQVVLESIGVDFGESGPRLVADDAIEEESGDKEEREETEACTMMCFECKHAHLNLVQCVHKGHTTRTVYRSILHVKSGRGDRGQGGQIRREEMDQESAGEGGEKKDDDEEEEENEKDEAVTLACLDCKNAQFDLVYCVLKGHTPRTVYRSLSYHQEANGLGGDADAEFVGKSSARKKNVNISRSRDDNVWAANFQKLKAFKESHNGRTKVTMAEDKHLNRCVLPDFLPLLLSELRN